MNLESRALLAAMEYTSLLSDNILLPFKKIYEYDFIFEKDEKFYRVKVISAGYKISVNDGIDEYEVNLRSSGGYNKTNTIKKPFDNRKCNWLFIMTPKDSYFIPASEITNKRSVNTKTLKRFKIRGNSSVG